MTLVSYPVTEPPAPAGAPPREAPARRRPVAAIVFGLLVALTLCGPWLAPKDPRVGAGMPYAPSSADTPLGTDHLGADVLSRVLSGGRTLVLLSVAVLLVAYLIGVTAGMLAAYRGGFVATLILRCADVLMGLPPLVLIAVIATGTGPGLLGVAVSVVAVMLPDITRIVRATTTQILAHDYVEVALARGESTAAILAREVLPNLLRTLAADASVRFAGTAYAVATAGFLGLGAQPPTPDWGLMIMENQGGLTLQPMAVLAPAALLLALLLTVGRLSDSLGFAPAPRRRRGPARGSAVPAAVSAPATRTGPEAAREERPEEAPDTAATVRGLRLRATSTGLEPVRGVDLTVPAGTVVALIGDSGSGKTSTALALLGHTNPGLERTSGTTRLFGTDLAGLGRRELARLRARAVAYVAQDPRTSLPGNLKVADQIGEQLRALGVPAGERLERARSALRRVALPDDPAFLARKPHQLSGGQLQRLSIAVALAREPRLLVLDEPTSALDPQNTARLVMEVVALCREAGTAVLLISHDLDAVARAADTVVVMSGGRVVSSGPQLDGLDKTDKQTDATDTYELAEASQADGTADDAADDTAGDALDNAVPLSVVGLCADRPGAGRIFSDATLTVPAGGRLCVVGASGSGKSTLLRAITGLVVPTAGEVRMAGEVLAGQVGRRSPLQRRLLQLVPQNPYDSLNPRQTVARIVGRPLRQFGLVPADRVEAETLGLVERVGLGAEHLGRRPAALSGGERQRVALARALAARPDVLLCDEITSALDRTTALSVLALLDELCRELGVALIVVTHDRLVVERIGGRIAQVADGRLRHLPAARAV
ncbi:ATP-binding cassette domain-containing protein [Streptomyces sp. NPDC006638]|uniref:ABC transporter ATP-binding protein/permease n=1 Tax=Streptomyces sp. NPDC006638 TaxID=3157183 RepID=UPI0033A5C4D3